MEKSLYHPPNGLYHLLNFSKPIKLPPKAVSKNHSKSQKNHKMKNSIVLDSKWVDLHSEYIIWYALVHFFTAMKKSIDLKLQQKNILKHIILYIHCVDLLIWSPTQLDFSFYDFFYLAYPNFLGKKAMLLLLLYYDFSKLL